MSGNAQQPGQPVVPPVAQQPGPVQQPPLALAQQPVQQPGQPVQQGQPPVPQQGAQLVAQQHAAQVNIQAPQVQPAIPAPPQQPQPAPVVVQQVPAPIPIYVRFPGEYVDPAAPNFIDYSLERERKVYKSAIAGIETKFDLTPTKLQGFLNRVQERVIQYDWSAIMNIVIQPPPGAYYMMGPMVVNLITHYGQVTREQVRQHAEVYMVLQDRRTQQSGMLFLFLTNSLDQDAQNIMDIDKTPYTINNMPDGVCFLKEIITKAYVDTNATVDTI
jgi:hypothetical protein